MDAVVLFDTERVCLGYVTVRPSTPVAWENRDGVAHRLVVTTIDDDAPVFEREIPSGTSVSKVLPTGFYRFTVDALPSFTGTVEVVEASEA